MTAACTQQRHHPCFSSFVILNSVLLSGEVEGCRCGHSVIHWKCVSYARCYTSTLHMAGICPYAPKVGAAHFSTRCQQSGIWELPTCQQQWHCLDVCWETPRVLASVASICLSDVPLGRVADGGLLQHSGLMLACKCFCVPVQVARSWQLNSFLSQLVDDVSASWLGFLLWGVSVDTTLVELGSAVKHWTVLTC